MTAATAQTVQYLNLAYFGRPADPASLTAFPATGMTDEQIVSYFVKTDEYITNTVTPNSSAQPGGGRTFNDTNLINSFYQRLFGRLAASSEITGWTNALATGAVNRDYLGITIMRAGLNLPAGTEMRSVLEAKFASANLFTNNLAANSASAQAYSTSAAASSGMNFLAGITTTTAATSAEADAAVTSMVAGGTASGSTFTLTTGTDILASFTGGTGNDTFVANLVNEGGVANNQTLGAMDTLDGGAGVDTLIATVKADVTPANLKNIEVFTLTNTNDSAGGASPDVVLTNADSITTINATSLGDPQGIALTGIQNKLTGGLNITNVSQGTVTATTVSTALKGSADELTVKVTSMTGGTVVADTSVANGYETITIESAGSVANTVTDLNDGSSTSYTTLKITGSQDLTVGTSVVDVVKTIDASAATGKVSVLGTTGDVNMTITGGSGNDTIDMVDEYEITDVIDGGAGTDVLRADHTDFEAVTAAISATKLKNIETIFADAAGAADINLTYFTGVSTLKLAGADGVGGDTYTFASGNTLHLTADIADGNANTNATIAGTGVNDVLNLTLDAGVDVLGDGTEVLSTTGIETINLTVASTAGTKNDFNQGLTMAATAGGNTKVVITGNNEVDFGGTLTTSIVDASALTAALTIAGTAAASNITGGTKIDTITASGSADIVSTGAGADIINVSGGLDVVTTGAGADTIKYGGAWDNSTDAVTITDFTAGSATGYDIISLDVSELDTAAAALLDNLDMDAEIIGTVGVAGSDDSSSAFASNKLAIITDLGFATTAAALAELKVENGGTDLTDIAVLYFNTTNSVVTLAATDTTASTTYDYTVATFSDMTTLASVSNFRGVNFTDH